MASTASAGDAMSLDVNPANGATSAELQDQSSILDELMATMAALEQPGRSHDYALHEKNIALCKQLGSEMADTLETAREMQANAFPLTDGPWLEWLRDKEQAYAAEQTAEAAQAVLDLYEQASQDYASIPIQQARLRFVTSQYHLVRGWPAPRALSDEIDDADAGMETQDAEAGAGDEELAELFSEELVRDTASDALARIGYNIAESPQVWDVLRDWELDLLRREPEPSPQQAAEVQAMFEARLEVPHQGSASTFEAFSRFTTTHNNEYYEDALVAAQKLYYPAERKIREREGKEHSLVQAGHSLAAFQEYITWELQVKKPDVPLVLALYERAVKLHYADPDLWAEFARFANTHSTSPDVPLDVARRAVRNVPWSGETWALAMRVFERRMQPATDVEALCAKAISTGLLDNSVDHLVAYVTGRAGYHRRRLEKYLENGGDDAEQVEALVGAVEEVLKDGIERVKRADKEGDPTCRLEKYLSSFLEGNDREDEAAKVWQKATKQHRALSSVWLATADFHTRRRDLAAAREAYTKAASAKLDYPEYLLQAWLQFEHHHGGLNEVENTTNRVRGLMRGIAARRQREAAAVVETAQTEAAVTITTQPAPAVAAEASASAATEAETSKKRPAEGAPSEDGEGGADAKRKKTEHPPKELKRDREHCTVLVSGLTPAHKEVELRSLFADCGEVREISVQSVGPNEAVGTVEFVSRESVLPALTKDKKRIDGHEVDVNLAWQSTLYVTNFPESTDDAAMKELFAKYGTILDVRWPSKRFKSTRRFCYIQFVLPKAAQNALELHGRELEPGLKLNVLVSDPERKKERTDAKANERELYVTGLSRFAKEADLQKLFSKHGEIKGIRMVTDDEGHSKGFAFVEFATEESAQSALSLNNHELKKRRIGVTIADGRGSAQAAKKDPVAKASRIADSASRSVNVTGVPEGTQEAIIQQAFEKHGKVKVVITQPERHAAVVEFVNAQDAGRLLLVNEPVEVNGKAVRISAVGASGAKAGGSGGAAPDLVPRTTAGRGGGRARGRGRAGLGVRARGGLGFGRGAASSSAPDGSAEAPGKSDGANAAGRSQDDFRAMLGK